MKQKEKLFLVLSGLFLSSLTMLNILGVTKFLDLSFSVGGFDIPVTLSVGVLAYPITFLCTDLISELYGEKRANTLVWVGLLVNFWVLFVIWLGDIIPGTGGNEYIVFEGVRDSTYACVLGSMVAYFVAQFLDVKLFHFFKRVTKGEKLWLRNNGSTLISQLIDTVAVVLVVWIQTPHVIPVAEGQEVSESLLVLVLSMYVFKLMTALLDTFPFYLLVAKFKTITDD